MYVYKINGIKNQQSSKKFLIYINFFFIKKTKKINI